MVRRLWNGPTMLVFLCLALACGVGSDDRTARRCAECMMDLNTTLHRLTVSGDMDGHFRLPMPLNDVHF